MIVGNSLPFPFQQALHDFGQESIQGVIQMIRKSVIHTNNWITLTVARVYALSRVDLCTHVLANNSYKSTVVWGCCIIETPHNDDRGFNV